MHWESWTEPPQLGKDAGCILHRHYKLPLALSPTNSLQWYAKSAWQQPRIFSMFTFNSYAISLDSPLLRIGFLQSIPGYKHLETEMVFWVCLPSIWLPASLAKGCSPLILPHEGKINHNNPQPGACLGDESFPHLCRTSACRSPVLGCDFTVPQYRKSTGGSCALSIWYHALLPRCNKRSYTMLGLCTRSILQCQEACALSIPAPLHR